jgi:hypothetical protein
VRNSETLIGRTKGDLMRTRIEQCGGCKILSLRRAGDGAR